MFYSFLTYVQIFLDKDPLKNNLIRAVMDRFYPKPTYVPPGYKKKNLQKKEIDSTGDPTPANFFLMILFSVLKRFVFAPTHIKIGIYMSTLVVCSLINDFNLFSRTSYLAQKDNFVNVYFVKLGWFWTLLVCTPFVLMTSIVYTGFNKFFIRNNLGRIFILFNLNLNNYLFN